MQTIAPSVPFPVFKSEGEPGIVVTRELCLRTVFPGMKFKFCYPKSEQNPKCGPLKAACHSSAPAGFKQCSPFKYVGVSEAGREGGSSNSNDALRAVNYPAATNACFSHSLLPFQINEIRRGGGVKSSSKMSCRGCFGCLKFLVFVVNFIFWLFGKCTA